ncbi:hypothetical protein HNP33_004231 [Comamonas odontotermitis]|uniref:Uncharacterized protein n=1 Tax=Comamonas odontotermitis TaxID=379895 RepID=A0ABR6RLN8_9BURK|nr:hypothetical protein [Comamonas odontotermitis]MBB6580100.1 hypothetical protein [Comamonas odontotermitis]
MGLALLRLGALGGFIRQVVAQNLVAQNENDVSTLSFGCSHKQVAVFKVPKLD